MEQPIEEIQKLSADLAANLGIEVYKVYFSLDGGDKVLHIELEKKGGIGLKEITEFTELINPELDKIESLDSSYILDCSSPGAERFIEIKDIDSYINEYVEVTWSQGQTLGTLIQTDEKSITINHFIKGRPKKDTILKSDIKTIQLRIKL